MSAQNELDAAIAALPDDALEEAFAELAEAMRCEMARTFGVTRDRHFRQRALPEAIVTALRGMPWEDCQ